MSNSRVFILFLGFILFFLAWLNILAGVILLITAEDTVIASFGVESMVLNITQIDKSDFMFHAVLRIALGFFILLIANSIIITEAQHKVFRPTCRDCINMVKK